MIVCIANIAFCMFRHNISLYFKTSQTFLTWLHFSFRHSLRSQINIYRLRYKFDASERHIMKLTHQFTQRGRPDRGRGPGPDSRRRRWPAAWCRGRRGCLLRRAARRCRWWPGRCRGQPVGREIGGCHRGLPQGAPGSDAGEVPLRSKMWWRHRSRQHDVCRQMGKQSRSRHWLHFGMASHCCDMNVGLCDLSFTEVCDYLHRSFSNSHLLIRIHTQPPRPSELTSPPSYRLPERTSPIVSHIAEILPDRVLYLHFLTINSL